MSKFDFNKKQYIGCIPVWAHPSHPTDQSPCIILDCPTCGKEMWVSEKKRAYFAEHQDTIEIHCLQCLAHAAHDQGLNPELADISDVH
jgi:hypothetical protein